MLLERGGHRAGRLDRGISIAPDRRREDERNVDHVRAVGLARPPRDEERHAGARREEGGRKLVPRRRAEKRKRHRARTLRGRLIDHERDELPLAERATTRSESARAADERNPLRRAEALPAGV